MFHKEFYPTPLEVINQMQIDCMNKVVLEPHAGKGDIIDFLNENGAKDVLSFEINEYLQKIVRSKSNLIGSDFFDCKSKDISHVELIVMNPPFSNAEKHIEHAFEIAPEGCEIIALCNYETIGKSYRYAKLSKLIDTYGIAHNLGDCFSDAERTTGIDIGLVKLFKPVVSDETKFEGFFMDEEEEEQHGEGIMQYNEVRALVQRYVGAMKVFDKVSASLTELEYTASILGFKDFKLNIGYNDNLTTKEEFSKRLQKVSWNYIIDKTGIRKMTTSLMLEDINKFVETQTQIPFTMKNIYHMLDMIVQTRGQQFDKALVNAVDSFTKHIHENRFSVEGWKTNNGHMLNKKIIVPDLFERGWNNANYVKARYGARYHYLLDDLVKVICSLCGENYDKIGSVYNYKVDGERGLQTGVWYDWGIFEFKCFYKGTMHLKFKDNYHWYLVNQAYGKSKGFSLPEKFK